MAISHTVRIRPSVFCKIYPFFCSIEQTNCERCIKLFPCSKIFSECDRSCEGCTGDGPDLCFKCADGYDLRDGLCTGMFLFQSLHYCTFAPIFFFFIKSFSSIYFVHHFELDMSRFECDLCVSCNFILGSRPTQ